MLATIGVPLFFVCSSQRKCWVTWPFVCSSLPLLATARVCYDSRGYLPMGVPRVVGQVRAVLGVRGVAFSCFVLLAFLLLLFVFAFRLCPCFCFS